MSVLRVTFAAATLLLLCSPEILHGRARVEGNQQRVLLDLENRWLNAEDDPDLLESILADDFIHVLPFGFVTKSEQLQYVRTNRASKRGTTKHFDDLRVRIFGDTGIVNGIVVATGADGNVRKTIFTDVFAYRQGRWRAVNAQESPFTQSLERQSPQHSNRGSAGFLRSVLSQPSDPANSYRAPALSRP